MPKISYEDYEYASEEEKDKDNLSQHSMNHSEDGGSDSAFNNGSSSDEVADVDEYAAFETDLEKYMYDLEKWNGIHNTRKYITKKKKNEGEDQRKRKYDGEEEAKRPAKSRKLGQLNSLAQTSEHGEHEEEVPMQEPTVPVSKEGEIQFDMAGNLWYEYHKDGIFIAGKYREDRKSKNILLTQIRTRHISPLDSCRLKSNGKLHRDIQ